MADLAASLATALVKQRTNARELTHDMLIGELRSLNGNGAHDSGTRWRLHANGFLKLSLVEGPEWGNADLNGFRLVLHVWHESTVGPMENVHNHRWPFWSTLLCGQLSWEHFQVEPAPTVALSHAHYNYASPGAAGSYAMSLKGSASLKRSFSATVAPGTSMAMSAHELHRVGRKGQEVSATVFLQAPPVREHTDVYVPLSDLRADPAQEVRHTVSSMSTTDVAGLLELITRRM